MKKSHYTCLAGLCVCTHQLWRSSAKVEGTDSHIGERGARQKHTCWNRKDAHARARESRDFEKMWRDSLRKMKNRAGPEGMADMAITIGNTSKRNGNGKKEIEW